MPTQEIPQTGAARLSVTRNITIDLPPAAAWRLVGGFGSLENWHPAVAESNIIRGVENAVGAVRRLTLMDGSSLQEQLMTHEPAKMRMRYRINASGAGGDENAEPAGFAHFPVSDYISDLSVAPAGRRHTSPASLVTWHGEFLRADSSETPADGRDDQAAIRVVTGIYETGLESLAHIASDTLSIQRVIGLYADGGSNGDASMVAKAFHASATMKFVRNGVLVDEPIAAFLKNYIPAGLKQNRAVRIDSIDIRGTAASARLTIDYPTHQFIDYFNLLKVNGEWLVYSKIFHRIDKA
ncbi:MAG: hypothetical protein EOO28_12220 [Comamonadaceae bacterium]|nr:MAG: hypothetical protein EOO28_12220 [Comamonadaceae bacterium]